MSEIWDITFLTQFRLLFTQLDGAKDYYDQQYKERIVKNMTRRAKMLGFELTPIMECTSEVP